MVEEKNVVNVSTKTKNKIVRYIHDCVYTGSILRDDYGTLQTIKNDFAENLSADDVENVNREKVTFSRK